MSKNMKKSPDELEAAAAKSRKETYEWIQCLSGALIFCVVIFVFFIRVIDVRGTSMNPTLNNQDKMLVSGLFYKPEAGDIVVFKKDSYSPDKALVKRVIAFPGDWVDLDAEGNVYVNSQPLDEPYLVDKAFGDVNIELPYQVPDGKLFVMGDHRSTSADSRNTAVGCVAEEQIVGRMILRVWPLKEIGWIK